MTVEKKKKLARKLDLLQTVEMIVGLLLIAALFLPRIVGIKPYVIKSGSMEPTISIGSIVYTKTSYSFRDVKKGDIIAFKLDDKTFVTHRVDSVHDEYVITKGDANKTTDNKYVYEAAYLGKIIGHVPIIGYLTSALQGIKAIIAVCILIAINVVITYFVSKTKKEDLKRENIGDKEKVTI